MKKFVLALTALTILTFAGACTSNPNSTTPSVSDSGWTEEKCAAELTEYAEEVETLAALVPFVTTQEELDALLDAGREAVAAGRRGVELCGKYAPAEAAEFSRSLNELESTLSSF